MPITFTTADEDGQYEAMWIAGLGYGPIAAVDAPAGVELATIDEMIEAACTEHDNITRDKARKVLVQEADCLGILPAGVMPELVNFTAEQRQKMTAALLWTLGEN